MGAAPATEVDRAAVDHLNRAGLTTVDVTWPDLPHMSLMPILFCESAASMEELDLSGRMRELKMQVPDAWPNFFRLSRFVSAIDLVQADRLRRRYAEEVARIFERVDVLLVPSLRDESLVVSNYTGHPSLTVRTGFVDVKEARSDWAPDPANPLPTFATPRRVPHGVTLIGRLFDEGTIARVGRALERATGASEERPPGF
jgi:Asp-tRNA(Asn)/Glu-tRNA(Gln) amidotransferase A subunit family amidase